MEQTQSGRKKWIKRVAGIFLFLLLVLTFFSNTIMNATLPQVTVQQIKSEMIQEQIKGSGTIKSEEIYEMIAEKSQIISERKKKTGDMVEEGEVLFTVQSGTEEEIKQREEELEQLEADYIKLVIETGISSEEKKKLEESGLSETECMTQLEAAKEEEREELRAKLLKELDIVTRWKAINKKREEWNELKVGTEVTAPVSGVLQQVTTQQTVQAGDFIAAILQTGDTMEVSFTVTSQEAAKVKVGDMAEVISPKYLQNVSAQLKSITTQETIDSTEITQSSPEMRLLTFQIEGEANSGENVTLAIPLSQGNYDFVVPISALQADKDGNFLLAIRTKTSPLGNRYYTERIPVTVQASDDTQAAVSGALYGNEYVIVTSNLPLEGGQQVRLIE